MSAIPRSHPLAMATVSTPSAILVTAISKEVQFSEGILDQMAWVFFFLLPCFCFSSLVQCSVNAGFSKTQKLPCGIVLAKLFKETGIRLHPATSQQSGCTLNVLLSHKVLRAKSLLAFGFT